MKAEEEEKKKNGKKRGEGRGEEEGGGSWQEMKEAQIYLKDGGRKERRENGRY